MGNLASLMAVVKLYLYCSGTETDNQRSCALYNDCSLSILMQSDIYRDSLFQNASVDSLFLSSSRHYLAGIPLPMATGFMRAANIHSIFVHSIFLKWAC